MNRSQIINDLMACLNGITTQAGFASQPKAVLRGIHLAEQMNEMPALCMFTERVETTDLTNSGAERLMILHVWGAARAVGSNFGDLDDLAAAVTQALGDHELNPHWARTSCLRLELYEGGAGDPLGLFDLEVQVTYETPLDQL